MGKPATKHFGDSKISPMYDNKRGVRFSLGIIATLVAKHMTSIFGDFSIKEEGGELVIHTGLYRASDALENEENCLLPCEGTCKECPSG